MKKKKELSKSDNSGESQFNYWAHESEYELGKDHPHRKLILQLLELEPFESLVEVGCNRGQNLELIQKKFPQVKLFGLDINERLLAITQKLYPTIQFALIGFRNKTPLYLPADILLFDASLMYMENINEVIASALNYAKRRIIIIDFFAETEEKIGHTIARNYDKLFAPLKVEKIKITKELWPTSEKWIKHGWCFVVHLPSQTSMTN